jgi:hypothetical protein
MSDSPVHWRQMMNRDMKDKKFNRVQERKNLSKSDE